MAAKRKKSSASRSRSRRQSRPPLRTWAYAAEAVFCVLVLGWLAYLFLTFLYTSEDFRIRTLRVTGANGLTEEAIVEVAGITQGDNLFFLPGDEARRSVEAMPYVKNCAVIRLFPDTVELRVTERTPAATLLINNTAYEMDDEYVVLRKLSLQEPHTDPFITSVPNLQIVELGEQLDRGQLRSAMAIWRAFSQTTMAGDVTVSELTARDTDDIRMYCDELPYVIRWGRGNYTEQAKRLDILWRQKGGRLGCTEYLDLRWDEDLACL